MQWSLSTRDKYDGIMYVQYTVEPLYKGQVGWYYVCTVYSGASLQGTSMTVLCMYSIQWSLSTRDKYVHTVYNGASLQGTSMMVYVHTVYNGASLQGTLGDGWLLYKNLPLWPPVFRDHLLPCILPLLRDHLYSKTILLVRSQLHFTSIKRPWT